MPCWDAHGYFYWGQPKKRKSYGMLGQPTACVDLDSYDNPADSNDDTEYRLGAPYQFRMRQPFTPTSNTQGFVGSIVWDCNFLYVKVQKTGDCGKIPVKENHQGQWKKIPLLPHIPDDGSEM